MQSSKFYRINRAILLGICSLGISLSIYAFYVEYKNETERGYRAACDIGPKVSCSAVFTSEYGRGFGIVEKILGKNHWINQPNSLYGILFYFSQILLDFHYSGSAATLQILMSVLANCGSLYLGYILAYVLHDLCVVCITTYFVNFIILLCNVARRRYFLTACKNSNSLRWKMKTS